MTASLDISQDRALLWLMAIACGLCAGTNYYAQPLIGSIQQYFQVPEAQVALTVTFAQVAYALGLLLIVPLGDIVNKSKFIPLLMLIAALGLFISAFSTHIYMLWAGTMLASLFSVAAQVLIPFATMAVKPEKTGQVIGFLMSGLLVGILLSTSLAGILSELWHWKAIYALSGVLMLIIAVLLKARLPYVLRLKIGYFDIFRSMGSLLHQEPRLVLRSLIGGCCFAAMSILFSTIALLLTRPPFSLTDLWIGLVTLVGVFGALSSSYLGRFADRGRTKTLTILGLITLLLSWALLYGGAASLLSYIAGYALIYLGLAMVHTANQGIVFRLRPDAKSRINSIYMTTYFIGGACGSALGVVAWQYGGWSMSCLVGVVLIVLAGVFATMDTGYIKHKPA
ncbi:MFS transporter [uncultured Acinetobacter sp.]|uniref:MFS transporter n=1 Tax=uncultured Acinetobacter sp. TaxID=165433 RepID=UPI00261B35B0|nr:MFS transporter [uncultured Acinetobacter sp.]